MYLHEKKFLKLEEQPTSSAVARARQLEGPEMSDEEDPKRDEGAKVDLRGLARKMRQDSPAAEYALERMTRLIQRWFYNTWDVLH